MVVSRETAEHYAWGEVCEGWRLLSRDGLSVIEERIPPGRGEVPHYHQRARQLFYVLSGGLTIDLPHESVALRAGEALEVEPGTVHRVHNAAADDAIFLVISSPTTAGDRVNVPGGDKL